MEWIADVDKLDHLLHSIGVPSATREDAMAKILTILAEAGAQRRDRRQLVLEAVAAHGTVREAAKAEGWSHETFYAELRPQKVKSTAAA